MNAGLPGLPGLPHMDTGGVGRWGRLAGPVGLRRGIPELTQLRGADHDACVRTHACEGNEQSSRSDVRRRNAAHDSGEDADQRSFSEQPGSRPYDAESLVARSSLGERPGRSATCGYPTVETRSGSFFPASARKPSCYGESRNAGCAETAQKPGLWQLTLGKADIRRDNARGSSTRRADRTCKRHGGSAT